MTAFFVLIVVACSQQPPVVYEVAVQPNGVACGILSSSDIYYPGSVVWDSREPANPESLAEKVDRGRECCAAGGAELIGWVPEYRSKEHFESFIPLCAASGTPGLLGRK